MPNIKHIVHVMLENRSFENFPGWLYEEEEKNQLRPKRKKGLNCL